MPNCWPTAPPTSACTRPRPSASAPESWAEGTFQTCPHVALGALCLFLFFFRLADRDLWSSHEARAAMDAQTVLDDGAWDMPRLFDGQPELQKPPLYYWLVALIARARGGLVDAWAERLPAALSALACVLLLVWFGRALGRPAVGLLAGTVLATALHFTWLARIGRIDMPLTLTVALAVGGFHLARKGPHGRRTFPALLLAYLALAVGVLLKGPVGLVLPAAVVGAHLLVEGELSGIHRPRSWLRLGTGRGVWWGVPLVAALTVPWFVWANVVTDGAFFREFFWHHNVERGFGGSSLRAHPWWYYGPQLAGDFLPWSPLLVLAIYHCHRSDAWKTRPELRLGAVWLGSIVLVLSCARFKRGDYLLPAYPGAALLLGSVLHDWLTRAGRSGRRALEVGIPVVAGAVAVGWLVRLEWLLPAQEPFRDYTRFAREIRRRAPAPEPVLFFRTEAHALAFHLGRPLQTLVHWQELDRRLAGRDCRYVVMPPESADEWPRFLPDQRLEEVLRNTDLAGGSHERPLVLLRVAGRGTGPPPLDAVSARLPDRK